MDELSPAEFVSDGEDESDDKTFLEVAEELGILATGLGKRKSDDSGKHSVKKCKSDNKSEKIKQGETTCPKEKVNTEEIKDKINNSKKGRFLDKIGEMTDTDRKAIGSLYLSLKEMRKEVKLTLKGLMQIQELIEKYPSVDFLYKILQPVSEIMPQNPLNAIPLIFMMSVVDYRSGGSKYKTEAVKKITPKRFVDDRGKLGYKCGAPGCLEIFRFMGKNEHTHNAETLGPIICMS